jgi:hypothetical protein
MARTDRSRRRLLAALAGAPLAGAAAVTATRLGANAAMLRPGAHDTSTQRCGQCGAPDHTMLDRRCPVSPEVV